MPLSSLDHSVTRRGSEAYKQCNEGGVECGVHSLVCVCTCVCACVLDVYSCVTKYHKLGCLEQCILLVSVSVEPRSGLTRSVMKVSVSPDLT